MTTGTFSSMTTSAFSRAPGIRRVTPAPKGLSVCFLIFRIDVLVCSVESGPVARTPRPPAFDTAATRPGTLIQLIPGNMMGYRIPNKSVILVFISYASMSLPGYSQATGSVISQTFTRRASRSPSDLMLARVSISAI